ncbi:MAG: hypothetical protein JWL83_2981 [Actinomycetia bacterium]|nr:hypothetical protein [Actinomycetes bacterium]
MPYITHFLPFLLGFASLLIADVTRKRWVFEIKTSSVASQPVQYVPYDQLDGRPNVIVDGAAADGTVLTLSHWPHSATPAALRADLSAEIAFRYLDDAYEHGFADLVSNNHLDEDGVAGVYALLEPDHAQEHRELLIEAARTGDFSCTHSRAGARLGFAITALIEHEGTYEAVLDVLPEVIDDLDNADDLWGDEDAQLNESAIAIGGGAIEINEQPDLDLSIVTFNRPAMLHPVALYNVIDGFCVLQFQPQPRIDYRYESWVQFVSRPVRQRRDLRPLAERLTAQDSVVWKADAPSDLIPSCEPSGESTLSRELVERVVTDYLREAPGGWDPFDPDGREASEGALGTI